MHKVVILDVSTYVGLSIGAIHTYGKLIHAVGNKRKTVQVERPMTAADAARENKKDRREGSLVDVNKPGQITSRLKDEEDVVKTALGMWKDHFPNAQVLLKRRAWTSEPGKILASPDDDRALQINMLWVDWLQAYDGGYTEDEIIELSGVWREEFNNFLATLPEKEYVPEEEANEHDWDMAEFLARQEKERARLKAEREAAETRAKKREEKRRREFKEWYDSAEFEEIELTVKAKTTMAKTEDGGKRGVLTFFTASAEAFDDDGNRIGTIYGGCDASVWLGHHTKEDLYRITVRDLWYAFEEALGVAHE